MKKDIRAITTRELRELLKPYGTPYRLSMKRQQLQEALARILKNKAERGTANDPLMEPESPKTTKQDY